MPGLNTLNQNFSGVWGTPPASYGAASSYASGAGVAAFSGMGTTSTPSTMAMFHPGKGFGMAACLGMVSLGALVFIRYSLPN